MSAPTQPPRWQEAVGRRLFHGLAPRLGERPRTAPPSTLSPFEEITFHRPRGAGILTATRFPAAGSRVRGTVLLLHPWTAWGRAYFHRHGRIEALRAAGFEAISVDLPGFGGSGPVVGFLDRDVETVLRSLLHRRPDRALVVWGVSSGGYWAIPAIGRVPAVAAAIFEDVSPHLLEWSWRTSPWGRPFYAVFRLCLPTAWRYLDLRRHVAGLAPRPTLFVGGELDQGVRPDETRDLAARAGGTSVIVPEAPHLGSIKIAPRRVLGAVLEVLERLEGEVVEVPAEVCEGVG